MKPKIGARVNPEVKNQNISVPKSGKKAVIWFETTLLLIVKFVPLWLRICFTCEAENYIAQMLWETTSPIRNKSLSKVGLTLADILQLASLRQNDCLVAKGLWRQASSVRVTHVSYCNRVLYIMPRYTFLPNLVSICVETKKLMRFL